MFRGTRGHTPTRKQLAREMTRADPLGYSAVVRSTHAARTLAPILRLQLRGVPKRESTHIGLAPVQVCIPSCHGRRAGGGSGSSGDAPPGRLLRHPRRDGAYKHQRADHNGQRPEQHHPATR